MSETLPPAAAQTTTDLLGPRPAEPTASAVDLLGPRPEYAPIRAGSWLAPGPEESDLALDEFDRQSASRVRVLAAFGHGIGVAWDHGHNLGYSDDVNDWLKGAGVYTDLAKGQGGVLRAFQEAMIRPAVAATLGLAGILGRSVSAGISGLQEAAVQQGTEWGMPGLGRDVAGMAEAFPLGGAELGGLSVHVPTRGGLLGSELGREMNRALSVAEVEHAAALNVIGPGGRSAWDETQLAQYGGPVTATQRTPITPTVRAQITGLQEEAAEREAEGLPPTEPPPLDIHAQARRIAPEVFAEYDPLSAQADLIRSRLLESKEQQRAAIEASAPHQSQIEYLEGRLADPDTTPRLAKKYQARLAPLVAERDAFLADENRMAALMADSEQQASWRRLLMETDSQMRDLAPQVSAAYREAAERFPETQIEAEPAAAVAEARAEPTAPVAEAAAEPAAPVAEAAAEPAAPVAAEPAAPVAPAQAPAAAAAAVPEGAEPPPAPGRSEAAPGGAVPGAAEAAATSPRPTGPTDVDGPVPDWLTANNAEAVAFAKRLGLTDQVANLARAGKTAREISDALGGRLSAAEVRAVRESLGIAPIGPQGGMLAPRGIPETAVPPASVESSAPGRSIRADVAAKLIAAGRPEAEANAAAEVVAAYYETRAARLGGARGTAEQLYADQGAAIRSESPRSRVAELAQRVTSVVRGRVRLGGDMTRPVITLMRGDANASTFFHEFGHVTLNDLLNDARAPGASADLVADAAAVRKWLGSAEGAELTRAQHERFARGFERYLMEGHAPSARLAGVFAQLKAWLTDIYQTVTRLRAPISDDIRAAFDRMLTTDPQRAVIAPERELVTKAEPKTPYVRAREPMRLATFIRRAGGVKDDGGDIRAMLGDYKTRPGLVNSRGLQLDDMARRAWEQGYFPEHDSVHTLEANDLLRKLDEDLRGVAQYSAHDDVEGYHTAVAHNAEIDRLAAEHGINPKGMTPTQFAEAVEAKVAEPEQDVLIHGAGAVGDEVSEDVRDWLADHDVPWDEHNIGEPRTLADLEAEHAAERSSGGPAETASDSLPAVGEPASDAADHARSVAAGGSPVAGEAGEGQTGHSDRDTGRETQKAAGRTAETDPAKRSEAATAGDEGTGLVDKAGNIRLDNLNSTEDVKQVLRELAAQNDDFQDARGGVITDAERRAMADALGLTLDNFVPQKPQGVSASVWAEAVQKLTFQASAEVSRLGKIAGDSGFPPDIDAYLMAKDRLLLIADHFATVTAEAGRTLRVMDKAGLNLVGDMVARIERDSGLTLYQIQQQARAVGAMQTTAQRARMVQQTRVPTMWQKTRSWIISLVVNNLISGPLTHGAYAIGNEVLALFKAVPLTAAEATIDAARSAFGAAPADRVYYGEIGAQLWGMFHGTRKGFVPGWEAFKSGIAYMEGEQKLLQANQGAPLPGMQQAATRVQTIPGKVGYALEAPGRGVSAIHTVFYAMNYERDIARRAFRAATNEGLTGNAFATRVADLTQNPSLGMVQGAHDEAMAAVLMKRPAWGSDQQKLASLVNNNLLAKLAMPFLQVGMNILDEGLIKSTPLGLASREVRDNLFGRNGEVARTQQFARIMVGSGLAAGTMALAAQGIITGAGPSDPRERALLEAQGWKAYSVRIGDTYIPYKKYLGPLGPLIGGAASIYEVGAAIAHGDLSRAVGSAILGFAHTVADESWMSGLAQFVDAAEHFDRDGEKYLRNLALNFIPYSVGLHQVARMVDQYQREVHGWIAAARNQIPGLSQGLYPQRDWTGTPIGSHTMMSPSVWHGDRTMAAMEAAEFYPAKLRRDVRGVPLDDRQYDDLARVGGRLAKQLLDGLVHSPGFVALPPGIQRQAMAKSLETARQQAETWLMARPENANILRQAAAAKAAIMQGQLPSAAKAIRQGQ